jgi:hypothetical protein
MQPVTPKALANFSPGFERRENPGTRYINGRETLKAFANLPNPFRVYSQIIFLSQGCRWRSNPGLKLANASA